MHKRGHYRARQRACFELVQTIASRAELDPDSALEVFRGATLALRIRSIGEAAGLEIAADGVGFRPARQPDAAPPMRQKQFNASGIGFTAAATSEAVTNGA